MDISATTISVTTVLEDSSRCAGIHALIDLRGVNPQFLRDKALLESVMRDSAAKGGATLLGINLHEFEGGGITGVAVLAESHISVHTWPEFGFAAFDVFMCGGTSVPAAVKVILLALLPASHESKFERRGLNLDKT